MLVARHQDGSGIRVAPLDHGYRGAFPPATAKAVRRLLARSLATLGLSGVQTAQLMNASPSTVSDAMRAVDEPEFEPAMPPDEPPEIPAPPPYERPATVTLSEKFIAKLRADYRQGLPNDDGQIIGNRLEVIRFLESLKAGDLEMGAAG